MPKVRDIDAELPFTHPINPVTGMWDEGKRSHRLIGPLIVVETRHHWRKFPNDKFKTLRTHRTGACAPKLRKWKHWNS